MFDDEKLIISSIVGECFDSRGSHYYMRARYYSPATGIFLSEDPIRDGLNWYTYCTNDPLNFIDPDGTDPFRQKHYAEASAKAYQARKDYGVTKIDAFVGGAIVTAYAAALTGGVSLSITGAAAWGGASSGLGYATYHAIEGTPTTLTGHAEAVLGGAALSGVGAAIASKAPATIVADDAVNGAGKWTNPDGSTKWPINDGFAGTPSKTTLQPGMIIDRYGYESGTFVSPKGISYGARSLAPGTELKPYNAYEVVKPIDAMGGKIAPWFDQKGGGTQYKFFNTIQELLDGGFIRKVGS